LGAIALRAPAKLIARRNPKELRHSAKGILPPF
jgi:hypothetical protein